MFKRSFNTLCLTFAALLLLGLFLTGCTKAQTVNSAKNTPPASENTPSSQPSTPAPSPATASHSVKLTLYFPNSDATGLVATERTVTMTDEEVIKRIFQELKTPPAGLEKPLPEGTTLLDASVSNDGVATINLSQEFQKNFKGGSSGEEMTIYSIVNTLGALSNVHSVQFLLEGKKLDGILGNLATDTPLKPNESLNI